MWECEYKGDKIAVTFRGWHRGNYLLFKEPYCLKCSFPDITVDRCSWHWKSYGYERIYAMGAYYPSRGSRESKGWRDFLSKHIRGLKQYPRYAAPLGLGLALTIKERYPELLKMDLIVPVPKFHTELKVATDPNGIVYNQAIELSKVISGKVDIPYREVLAKNRAQKMRTLDWEEKWKAVRGLYKVSGEEEIIGKKIILVDDVSTSGATASECSQILIDSGAKIVNVLIAGRNVGTG